MSPENPFFLSSIKEFGPFSRRHFLPLSLSQQVFGRSSRFFPPFQYSDSGLLLLLPPIDEDSFPSLRLKLRNSDRSAKDVQWKNNRSDFPSSLRRIRLRETSKCSFLICGPPLSVLNTAANYSGGNNPHEDGREEEGSEWAFVCPPLVIQFTTAEGSNDLSERESSGRPHLIRIY